MKIERTKNAARNIVFDGLLKLLNMVIPSFCALLCCIIWGCSI